MENRATQIKVIGLLVLCLVVGLIGFAIFTAVNRNGKVQVSILTIPSDAKISLNGKRISSGDNYLPAGDYKVVIEKSGFDSFSNTVYFNLPSGVIDIGLTPRSDEAKAWAEQHNRDYMAFEARAGQRADDNSKKFINSHPVVGHLPFKNFLFTIGYFIDPADESGNSIIVTIDASENYRQAAINKIKEWGLKPAELNIIFTGYESPFAL